MHYIMTVDFFLVFRSESLDACIESMVDSIVKAGIYADSERYGIYDSSDIEVVSVRTIHLDFDHTYVAMVDIIRHDHGHNLPTYRYYPHAPKMMKSRHIGFGDRQ